MFNIYRGEPRVTVHKVKQPHFVEVKWLIMTISLRWRFKEFNDTFRDGGGLEN